MIENVEVGKRYLTSSKKEAEVLFVGATIVVYRPIELKGDIAIYIDFALKNWEEIIIERETIELSEYVCSGGAVKFLTEDKDFVYHQVVPRLIKVISKDKFHKIPNGRIYKIYADTLEVKEWV